MSKMKNQIWDVAEAIDVVFGEGYAKKNPELLGRIIQAQTHEDTMLASTEVLYDILRVISTPLIVKNPQ
ncbi:hypothetical protein UFOVP125_16 [uncultured Caudovirales phage]|uniref:Uncharacterized protein n=1 Tax=uncultured Caudovirales phage TaxID=2100421 RepID=A0A6J5LF41_9CAUD|nr:hypothetical protein UFOVP125_16 [uncultured Caudovirales phage]